MKTVFKQVGLYKMLTAINESQDNVFGVLELDTENVMAGVTYHWNFLDSFRTDISSLTPTTAPYTWRVQWYLNLYCEEVLARSPLFISALPKYELGSVEFAFQGMQTNSQFWNFLSQRFAVQVCWLVNADMEYPAPEAVPSLETNADLRYLSLTFNAEFEHYATDLYLKVSNAVLASMQGYVYYQASAVAVDLPVSWGNI